LDGTLLDTASVVLDSLNFYRKKQNKPELLRKDILPWLSIGGQKLIENALNLNETLAISYLEKFRKRYSATITPINCIYPEAVDTLENLNKKYKLSICTNKPRKLAEKALTETNLIRYFQYMCAGDDLITSKPHPENLESCMHFFSVKADEVVFVGDSTVDQKLANACKVRYVHYDLGYNDGVIDGDNLFRIKKHSELLEYLSKID
jgi:phosphoglycolate phosphatase